MIISRDKEFIRRKDEARQPAREPVKDTLAGKDRSVQDYDLRRARDAPATSKGRHRQRQPEPEYPSAAVEGALEEQNSYLSDREADISRTGADAASFYEKTVMKNTDSRSIRESISLSGSRSPPVPLEAPEKLMVRSIPNTGVPCTSMATNIISAFRRRQRRRNSRSPYRRMRKRLPSWSLPLTSSHRRQRIKN